VITCIDPITRAATVARRLWRDRRGDAFTSHALTLQFEDQRAELRGVIAR
jgi:hypothetical protein